MSRWPWDAPIPAGTWQLWSNLQAVGYRAAWESRRPEYNCRTGADVTWDGVVACAVCKAGEGCRADAG